MSDKLQDIIKKAEQSAHSKNPVEKGRAFAYYVLANRPDEARRLAETTDLSKLKPFEDVFGSKRLQEQLQLFFEVILSKRCFQKLQKIVIDPFRCFDQNVYKNGKEKFADYLKKEFGLSDDNEARSLAAFILLWLAETKEVREALLEK